MATGPEFYKSAQHLINTLNVVGEPTAGQILRVQIAQVHATLALAAAVAMGKDAMLTADWTAWREAASAYREDGAQ